MIDGTDLIIFNAHDEDATSEDCVENEGDMDKLKLTYTDTENDLTHPWKWLMPTDNG